MKLIIESKDLLDVIDKCVAFAANNDFDPNKSFSEQSGLDADEILEEAGCEYEVQNEAIYTDN